MLLHYTLLKIALIKEVYILVTCRNKQLHDPNFQTNGTSARTAILLSQAHYSTIRRPSTIVTTEDKHM
jgi:hypothetical protein